MKRREFTKLAGTGLTMPYFVPGSHIFRKNTIALSLIQNLIEFNDSRIPSMLDNQEKDPSSRWYGGIIIPTEVFYPGHSAGFIKNLCCSYVSTGSKYFKSPELLSAMGRAVQ